MTYQPLIDHLDLRPRESPEYEDSKRDWYLTHPRFEEDDKTDLLSDDELTRLALFDP